MSLHGMPYQKHRKNEEENSYVWNSDEEFCQPNDLWPAYIILKDKSIIIFKGELKLACIAVEKGNFIGYGRIDVNKWVCYNKDGRDLDSTEILRRTLSV